MLIVFLLILSPLVALAQPRRHERAEEPLYRGGDTVDLFLRFDDSTQEGQLRRVDPLLRFLDAFRRDSSAWRAFIDSIGSSPEAAMNRNLAFNARDWLPTQADQMRRQEDIDRALDRDNIGLKGITHIPLISIPLSSIGQILGLTEDVTPHIGYTVPNTQSVSVKIYNLSAQLVKSIVDGVERPGVYSFDWNMLDEKGKRVSSGDYVAEVLVGKRLVLRKRIVVP